MGKCFFSFLKTALFYENINLKYQQRISVQFSSSLHISEWKLFLGNKFISKKCANFFQLNCYYTSINKKHVLTIIYIIQSITTIIVLKCIESDSNFLYFEAIVCLPKPANHFFYLYKFIFLCYFEEVFLFVIGFRIIIATLYISNIS